MANGDLIKLGTLYLAGAKQVRPTYPWQNNTQPSGSPGNGNIQNYGAGQTIEIRDTDSNDAYKINWIEVNDGAKKLLIADRNLLVNISWDDLNALGLITGKTITIDGQQYLLRVLTGGNSYRNTSDGNAGGSPVNNEWDRIITNESSFSGLPTPITTDLNNTQNETVRLGVHNSKWNWYYCYSWVQETYLPNNAYRSFRGYSSARYFNYTDSSTRTTNVGWRPALEVLNTAPLISGNNGNLGEYAAALNKTYSITDPENDTVSLVEKIDGAIIRTLNAQASGQSYIINLSEQWNSLSIGEHTIVIEATDSKGLKSVRTWTFTKVNSAPGAPILLYPKSGMRTEESFHARFAVSIDPENDMQKIKIQIAENNIFSLNLEEYATGLEKNVDGLWIEHSENITNADYGSEFRIKCTSEINKEKYIRVCTTDQTSGVNSYSSTEKIKIGNKLEFKTLPEVLNIVPYSISVVDKKNVDSEATLKVYVCNNALDDEKVWEDMTNSYWNGEHYVFNNTNIQGPNAVAVKYVVQANNSIGEISISSVGIGVS